MFSTSSKAELREILKTLPGKRGLVMTMGALHDGHRALLKECRKQCDVLVASIYVNPLQFGPGEDYEAYPRPLEQDLEILRAEGVDVAFTPVDGDIYPNWPNQPLVTINPGPVASLYEGAQRPTHFAGVLQIVNKVFNLVQPDISCFGQKDAQQLALIRTMVRDLDIPVEIVPVALQRDIDGLALSSRNAYLSAEERQLALNLSRALKTGEQVAKNGGAPVEIVAAARQVLSSVGLNPDYLILVDPVTFERLDDNRPGEARLAVLALACRVGKTRLLDNLVLTVGATCTK